MLNRWRAFILVLAVALFTCGHEPMAAQGAPQAPKAPPALKLQPEKVAQITPGSVAIAEGLASSQPIRMWLDNLGINQPVTVVLASTNPAVPLNIALTKTAWEDSLHPTTTGADGSARLQVRTQGEMGMRVSSAGGKAVPFLLAVWVGDEVTPDMQPVFVAVKDYSKAGGASWTRWLIWAACGLGGVALLGFVFWLGRRGGRAKNTTAALMLAVLVGSALIVHAEYEPQTLPGLGPGTAPQSDIGNLSTLPGTTPAAGGQPAREVPAQDFFNRWGTPANPGNVQASPQITPGDIQAMRDIDANQQVARERGMNVQQLQPGVDIPTPQQAQQMMRDATSWNSSAGYGAAADARTAGVLQSQLEQSRGMFQANMARGLSVAAAFVQGWQILHSSDGGCVPDVSPASLPQVPSMCAGSAECRACYTQAYDQLNRIRFTFEKLRCVYNNTKDIGTRATSFGDTVSPIHGVSGLAWQVERRKIEQAMNQLNQSYDAKYTELLGKLGEDMQSINACETQYFGNPDWYSRYGFMFYTFMSERYKR